MQQRFSRHSATPSSANRLTTAQKSQIFKSKHIFKQSKQCQSSYQGSGWSRHQKGVLARWLLRIVSRDLMIERCFYENVSRQIQKSPKNVYNFHLKLLSLYRTNQNIISSILGGQYAKLKYNKLKKTPTHTTLDLNPFNLNFVVPDEVNYILDSFLTTELNFMEAICLIDQTPQGDLDHFYNIQILEYETESGQCYEMGNLQNMQIECE